MTPEQEKARELVEKFGKDGAIALVDKNINEYLRVEKVMANDICIEPYSAYNEIQFCNQIIQQIKSI